MKQKIAFWIFKPLLMNFTLAICLMGNIVCADDSSITSQFTSIKDADCSELPMTMTAYYDKRQIDGDECPSQQGWHVFKAYWGGGWKTSWIDIAHGDTIWSTESIIRNDESFGFALHITGKQVEWRVTQSGIVNALFFRISDVPPLGQNKIQSRLFVVSLTDGTPCFCGMAKNDQEARDLADKKTTCTTMLPKQVLPVKTK